MVGKVLLLIAALVACSWSQVIYAPVPPKPSGSNDVVAVLLQNPLNVSISSQYITFGHPFYRTQLVMPANTSIMTAYWVDSNKQTVEVQVDGKAFHADGSVRQATLTVLHPAIPANTTLTLMLTRTLRATTALSVSGIPASVVRVNLQTFNDYQSQGASQVNATYNWDVKQLISAAPTQDFWLKGELAVQTRVATWVESSMRMVFDTTLFKDNSWCVDVIYTNDIAMSPIGGNLIYDTTITPAVGNPIVYKNLTHHQYQGFHKVVCSAGISRVNVQYDQLNMIQASAIFPLNYTIGINYNVIKSKQDGMKGSWGTPFSPNGVTQYMPMTGGRADIGPLPGPMADWFVSQDIDAKKFMMGFADAAHSVPWSYYLNKTGRYLNYLDNPGLWIDGRGNPKPTQLSDGANGWDPDGAHTPSLTPVPYTISGSRYYLDLLLAEASWKIMTVWNAYRGNFVSDGNYGVIDLGLVVVGVQERDAAWTLRDIGWASWFAIPGSFESYYFNLTIANNLEFLMRNQTPEWTQLFGEVRGFIYLAYGSNGMPHPPWQDDYYVSALAMLAMQGYSRAADVMLWMRNFMVMGALTNGWNRNNRMAYNIYIGYNTSAFCKTWQCMQDVMVLNKADMPDLQHLGGVYGQLARLSFIMYQMVFPQDTDATAARIWIDNAKASYVDTATFLNEPQFNPGNFPLAVPLNYTFTPGTPGPTSGSGSGSTTSSPSSSGATPSPAPEDGAASTVAISMLLVVISVALYML